MSTETEIKYRVRDLPGLEARLLDMDCDLLDIAEQEDILFNIRSRDFEQADEALRLRILQRESSRTAFLTYKGTPHVDEHGVKHRDEFETEVSDPDATRAILEATDFFEELVISKERRTYDHPTLHITTDALHQNGEVYLELEGEREDILAFAANLGLKDSDIETRPYFRILFPDYQTKHQQGTVPPRA